MRLIIGGYRKKKHIVHCLRSIEKYVLGHDEIIFIDDSGDAENRKWLEQFGRVVDGGKRGFTNTMAIACGLMDGEYSAFWEEDFVATAPIHLGRMAERLEKKPHLAQIALLRQPWFDVEKEHGGIIPGLKSLGHQFDLIDGLWEHQAVFTTNPSVWRKTAWIDGWPQVEWSEAEKTKELVARGFKFAWMDGVKLHHDGRREGMGY